MFLNISKCYLNILFVLIYDLIGKLTASPLTATIFPQATGKDYALQSLTFKGTKWTRCPQR